MRILSIGGNHPRHLYYVNKIRQRFDVCGMIVEIRENILPSPPDGIDELDRQNFIRHFNNRDTAEKKYFGQQIFPQCPKLELDASDLSSARSAEFVKSLNPDVALIFGSGVIRDPLFSALPRHTINLHLGITPRYRGAATLFWPFYFMEPSYAGSTFHYIVAEVDAGDVVHQVLPKLDPSDKIHDVACKTVVSSAEEAVKLLELFEKNGYWDVHRQKGPGKNFQVNDFRPEHLRVIYNYFDDDIVKQYLVGRLKSRKPRLIRQL